MTTNRNIRNMDANAYRELKAQAAREGRTIREVLSDAIRAYVESRRFPKGGSLQDFKPEPFPKGNERLSEEIDLIVYGTARRHHR